MDEDDELGIECATYTHARRHPMVLGHIGGWTPPFQLSLPQLGAVVVTVWLEVQTYRIWGGLLPKSLSLIAAVALPVALAWAVRSARAEGRSLPRTAFAFLTMAWMPRNGQVNGRPYRHARPGYPGATWVYVAPGEEER